MKCMSLFPRRCPSLNTCLIAAVKAYSALPILQPPSLLNEDIFSLFFIISFIFRRRLLSLSLCLSPCLPFECLCLAELQLFFFFFFCGYISSGNAANTCSSACQASTLRLMLKYLKLPPGSSKCLWILFRDKDVQIFERAIHSRLFTNGMANGSNEGQNEVKVNSVHADLYAVNRNA